MSDTTVTLGELVFTDTEVPESIPWGGSQRTAVHELIGGGRQIDAMGRADADLPWSGLFTGASAVSRAKYLDTLRIQGTAQNLTWGEFSYSVLVSDFKADYTRFYRIPYHITCQVIADLANPTTTVTPATVDSVLADDLNSANTLGLSVGDGLLSTLLAALDTAIGAVASFANAAQSVITSVLEPLSQVQERIATLITISGTTLGTVTTFGGVLPGIAPALSAAALSGQSANLQVWEALFSLQALTARMAANLASLKSGAKTITVAGGNLFQIAQVEYGDPMAWTGIAKANGLTDPFLDGPITLVIPLHADTADGLLSA